jgi:hypothetical protein
MSPKKGVRAKLNRLGLTMVGDISWPEHVAIFTMPFRVARATGIPFLFYGENPQNQYGGPMEALESQQMTRRWVSEFGGFLGLRPQDLIGIEGLSEEDLADYMLPDGAALGVEAHFLGQYIPWDSHRNAAVARKAGMRQERPARRISGFTRTSTTRKPAFTTTACTGSTASGAARRRSRSTSARTASPARMR